jgi:thermitase
MHYLYQEGEVLMVTTDLERLETIESDPGNLPRLSRPSLVELVRRPYEDELLAADLKRDAELAKLGITRLRLSESNTADVPETVVQLRTPVAPAAGSPQDGHFFPRAHPNHVLALQLHAEWHSGGPVTPAGPLGHPLRRRFWPLPGHKVTIGLLDTGMWTGRIDWFGGAVQVEGEDPLGDASGRLNNHDGHGTFAAGIIHKHAPGAKVVARALPGEYDAYVRDTDVALALLDMARSGVDIINLSAGGPSHGNVGPIALAAAIEELRLNHPKVVLVSAAGNSGSNAPEFPAALNSVIGVGAIDDAGQPADFTSRGDWVNAAAPGVDVHSTFVDWPQPRFDGFARWSGTSFAAPAVAAAIATRRSPGGWRQYLWFLRPRNARDAADRVLHNPSADRLRGLGTIVRPPSYET